MQKKKFLSLFCVAFFALTILLSNVYITRSCGHVHDHLGQHLTCSVCENVQTAKNLLQGLNSAKTSAILFNIAVFAVVFVVFSKESFISKSSLLSLKVRFNN
jgi:uncharacterized membrane protein (DUF485 family)